MEFPAEHYFQTATGFAHKRRNGREFVVRLGSLWSRWSPRSILSVAHLCQQPRHKMPAIYHITHADNLVSILESGGLWSDAQVAKKSLPCVGIAHEHLKARRARRRVVNTQGEAVAAGGTLSAYVPFYFANRSPMLS